MGDADDLEMVKREARTAWNENAAFWDEKMGEGNDFFEVLVWPPTMRLLQVEQGHRVLDIACGNGLTSRRLAAMGAHVVAFDHAENMINRAQDRTTENRERIAYSVLDATDEQALRRLGDHSFDRALCNMALFDMVEVSPLLRSLGTLLKTGGTFVFSVIHPCFNNVGSSHIAEVREDGGKIETEYSVKVWKYMTLGVEPAIAIPGQPTPHPIVHRTLQELFGACFSAGLVLDGLEERAFPPDYPEWSLPLGWNGHFSEIPAVLVARISKPF